MKKKIVLAMVMAASALTMSAQKAKPLYLDTTAPLEQRVQDLPFFMFRASMIFG